MRVNTRVFDERLDMLDGIRIPNCPSQLKVVAENIVNMATKLGYAVGNYNTMTNLDKILMVDYWREFDGLTLDVLESGWREWFINKATLPDLITRARRWLVEHNYLIIPQDITDRAYSASEKFSKAVKG